VDALADEAYVLADGKVQKGELTLRKEKIAELLQDKQSKDEIVKQK
jgi:hypothetical protein